MVGALAEGPGAVIAGTHEIQAVGEGVRDLLPATADPPSDQEVREDEPE
jgi:hypothetical protein